MFSVPCVCLCVRLSVCALEAKPLALWTWKLAHILMFIISRTSSKVKVIGQMSRSPRSKNVKIPVFSLVSEEGQGQMSQRVKVNGCRSQCQRCRSRSNVTKVKVYGFRSSSQSQGQSRLGSFLPPSTRGRFDTRAFSFKLESESELVSN